MSKNLLFKDTVGDHTIRTYSYTPRAEPTVTGYNTVIARKGCPFHQEDSQGWKEAEKRHIEWKQKLLRDHYLKNLQRSLK